MQKLSSSYLILIVVLGGITITTVLADTVTISTYPYTIQDGSSNQRLVITSSGNVGIGTSSPVSLLQVGPDGSYSGRQIAAGYWADLSGAGGGQGLFAGNAYLNNSDSSTRFANTHGIIGAGGLAVNSPSWNNVGIFVNNGPSTAGSKFTPNWIATFTPTGVGIGTTTPSSTLDVSGGLSVGSYGGTISAPSNGAIISGDVGIGTSSPVSLLQVGPDGSYSGRQIAAGYWADLSGAGGGQGLFAGNAYLNNIDSSTHFANTHGTIGASGLAVNSPSWNQVSIFANNGPSTAGSIFTPNWIATFTPTGVGIGTTVPAQKLDVTGNIRLTGNIVSPNDICIGSC